MNLDESAIEPRQIVSIDPDDGGSMVKLVCGHLIWCALPPSEFKRTLSKESMYCSSCVFDYLESVKRGKPGN